MSNDASFFTSRFWAWCARHRSQEQPPSDALKEEALALLVQSVNAGEVLSFDGVETEGARRMRAHHLVTDFEMNSHWIGTAQDWSCPCCERSKFAISRVGKRNRILAKLVIHHDHMGEALKAAFHQAFEKAGTEVEQVDGQRLVERIGNAFAAYEKVLICEDCNNADVEAKKLVSAPAYFSFSIGQMRSFICAGDHRPHEVDSFAASRVWQDAKPAYELRMKIIRAVAHAAATDSHWYEPHARRTAPIPVFGYGCRMGDSSIQQWVSSDALYAALGPEKKPESRNLSRWRIVRAKAGRSLPSNFLAMLRSEETCATIWDSVPDEWACPVCKRSKRQLVYVAENRVKFYLSSNAGRGSWSEAPVVCNHCSSVLMSFKWEVEDLIGRKLGDSYGFVSPVELASIVAPRPNSPHSIRSAEAAALVTSVVERLG